MDSDLDAPQAWAMRLRHAVAAGELGNTAHGWPPLAGRVHKQLFSPTQPPTLHMPSFPARGIGALIASTPCNESPNPASLPPFPGQPAQVNVCITPMQVSTTPPIENIGHLQHCGGNNMAGKNRRAFWAWIEAASWIVWRPGGSSTKVAPVNERLQQLLASSSHCCQMHGIQRGARPDFVAVPVAQNGHQTPV